MKMAGVENVTCSRTVLSIGPSDIRPITVLKELNDGDFCSSVRP